MDLLDLDAIYEGTQYDGRLPWELQYGYLGGGSEGVRPLCARDKNPTVKAGVVREKVDTVLRLVAPKFPSIEIEGDESGELAARILAEGRLKAQLRGPLCDALVKGSGALGFALLGSSGRVEVFRRAPEWCVPIFVCRAGGDEARAIRVEIEALIEKDPKGSEIVLPDPGDPDEREHLWTPDDAPSHELCWLRYEFATRARVRDAAQGSAAKARIDYTPHCTIYYRPQQANAQGGWAIDYVERHDYGFVPVQWERSTGADDGEAEGPTLISEPLRTVAEAADYTLTRKDEAVGVVSNPKLVTINLQDIVANFNADRGGPTAILATSKETLAYKTGIGQQGSAFLLEPTGAGPESARKHLDDLDARAFRISGVLSHDPQQAAAAQSGTALERMMAPTLAVAGDLVTFGTELLTGLVSKIARALGKAQPKVTVQWGPLVEKTSADRQAEVTGIMQATGGLPVMSQATGVKMACDVYGIEDAEAELAALGTDTEGMVDKVRRELDAEGDETTTEVVDPGAKAPITDVQKLALNGAQVTALLDALDRVAKGLLPRATVKQMLIAAFQVDDVGAEAMLAPLDGFVVAEVAPPAPVHPPPLPRDA